jgi:hypothetical protein
MAVIWSRPVGLQFETCILIGRCDVWRAPSAKECYFWAVWAVYVTLPNNEPCGTGLAIRLSRPPARRCLVRLLLVSHGVYACWILFYRIHVQFLAGFAHYRKETYAPVSTICLMFPLQNVKNYFGWEERSNSMQSSPLWASSSRAAGQEFPCPEIHYRLHRSSPLVLILSLINLSYILIY